MNFSKLDKFMDEMTLRGVPGCELAVSLNRDIIYRKSVGFADAAKTRPMSNNDIYWIFSCTKVITCVAAMRLVENGTISLDDPVSKYIPEFASLNILDKKSGIITPAKNTMTVQHLFTMTGGLNYQIDSPEIKDALANGRISTLDLVKQMAKMPLDFEPGSNYQYSLCHDVLAAVVEVASGMRYSEYLQKNIFDPLGMKDIGFRPNEAQKARFCDQYTYSNGTNTTVNNELRNRYALSPDYDSGGAGLFSTVDEYMKFITVLANGGKTTDGYSLLRPETIEMLGKNRLHDVALNTFVNGRHFGYGYGLCGRVHRDPVVSFSKSSVGEFGWDGAAGAFNMVDAKKHVAIYFGTNIFGFIYGYYYLHPMIRNLVYEALDI